MSEELTKSNKDRRLTLDEMYDIFMGDAYKDFREQTKLCVKTAENGKRYVEYIIGWFNNDVSPLLYQHIAAEQLIQAPDYQKVNWRMVSLGNTFAIIKLLDLCMNPLVWVGAEKFKDIVIEGRVAEEDYDATRYIDKYEMFDYLNNQGVLRFADELPCCDEDSLELGYTKGMHYWLEITLDDSKHFRDVLNGASADFNEWQKAKGYNLGRLRDNLTYIAKERGGDRAAMILHLLQKEWPKIKLWKTHFENMTEDDICHFENGLFHGFDDLLEEWEAGNDAPKEQPKTIKKAKNQSVCKSQPFETLLQCPQDQKEHVMSRLHELLDNKGGKHVAMILMAAKSKESLLLDIPTEKQYTAEFTLNGTWRAVSDYIKKCTLQDGRYSVNLDHISIQ